MRFQTFQPDVKVADAETKWYVVDAAGMNLGRLASRIAAILRGKHKTTFVPHQDMGDFVIIINAAKITVTGDRLDSKLYSRHSLYPGGFRQVTLRRVMETFPDRALEHAIKGMLPHNRLGRQMVQKLKIYAGETHPHGAQMPQKLEFPEARKDNG